MKIDKEKTSMLLSIISLNLYSLKKYVYGSSFEQASLKGLKDLPNEIELLIMTHRDTNYNGQFDISDWPQSHKTNLENINNAYKELTQ